MSSFIKIARRLYGTLRRFGALSCVVEVLNILRYKLFENRRYTLLQLRPVVMPINSRSRAAVSITIEEPRRLGIQCSDPSFELTDSFLSGIQNAKAVVARDSNSGQLLAYGFFCLGAIAIDSELYFVPPELSLYLFKFFVVPSARGKRIFSDLVEEVLRLPEHGALKAVYANVIQENFPSLRAFCKMGFRKLGTFTVVREASGTVSWDEARKKLLLQ